MGEIRRLNRNDLKGKVIDAHSHVGVGLKEFCRAEYPYAQSAESLYYRQLAGKIDVNVVFPFLPGLQVEPSNPRAAESLLMGQSLPDAPFALENRVVMREVYEYLPELSHRFIPFVSVDPGKFVDEQLNALIKLEELYPIYGIKVHPVGCHSHATALLDVGRKLLDFAEQRNIPYLFHSTTIPNDEYSQASDILRVADSRPAVRFCLAHCVVFNREMLDAASRRPNVWVDTAAFKIQVDFALQCIADGLINEETLLNTNYSDYLAVMKTLCETYPQTILWGTDSPAYTYRCERVQGDGIIQRFALKGRYEHEVAALNSLPAKLRDQVCNENTLDFLFGRVA